MQYECHRRRERKEHGNTWYRDDWLPSLMSGAKLQIWEGSSENTTRSTTRRVALWHVIFRLQKIKDGSPERSHRKKKHILYRGLHQIYKEPYKREECKMHYLRCWEKKTHQARMLCTRSEGAVEFLRNWGCLLPVDMPVNKCWNFFKTSLVVW